MNLLGMGMGASSSSTVLSKCVFQPTHITKHQYQHQHRVLRQPIVVVGISCGLPNPFCLSSSSSLKHYKFRCSVAVDASSGGHIPALLQDAGAAALVTGGAYYLVLLFDNLTQRQLIKQNLSRKVVHILSGLLFMLSWPIFSISAGARYFAAFVPLLNGIRLVIHGLSLAPDEGLVKSVTREGNPKELLRGPLYYVVVLVSSAVLFWRDSPVGVIALAMMCGGDGFADIIGRRFGSVKIPYNQQKSLIGSISMFASGFSISVVMLYYFSALGFFQLDWSNTVERVALVALVATIVESLSTTEVLDDNISVPLSSMLMAFVLFSSSAIDADELFDIMNSADEEDKEKTPTPPKVVNDHVPRQPRVSSGGSHSKKRKSSKAGDGGGKKKKELEVAPVDVSEKEVHGPSGPRSGGTTPRSGKRSVSWLAPDFVLPTDEYGCAKLADEVANVAKLKHVGTPGNYPPFVGMGKVARIIDLGLCEDLKEQDVHGPALLSHLGDFLSEVGSFANSMSSWFEAQVGIARAEAEGAKAEMKKLILADSTREEQLNRAVADAKNFAYELNSVKKRVEVEEAENARLQAQVDRLSLENSEIKGEKKDLENEIAELRVDPKVEAERKKLISKEKFQYYQRGQFFTIRAFLRRSNFDLSPMEQAELLKTTNNVLVKDDHAVVPFDREELARLKEKCPDWQVPKPIPGNVVECFYSMRKLALPYDVPIETVLPEGENVGEDQGEDAVQVVRAEDDAGTQGV